MTLEDAIKLIRALIGPDPEDEGGCCRYCHMWTGTSPEEPHRAECAYAMARTLVGSP